MTQIESLFQLIEFHHRTGNSTWIFEMVKWNPKCRILYSHASLAKIKEGEYIDWFRKTHGAIPVGDQLPHFCGIGSITYHHRYSHSVPLILDNSCLSKECLDQYKSVIFNKGHDAAVESMNHYLASKNNTIQKLINLITSLSDKWYIKWFPWRRKSLVNQLFKITT